MSFLTSKKVVTHWSFFLEILSEKNQGFQRDLFLFRRIRNLEGSMTELLKSHEKKIKALEVTLKEVKQEKMTLEQNLEVLQLKVPLF